jgi:hypothetical protein
VECPVSDLPGFLAPALLTGRGLLFPLVAVLVFIFVLFVFAVEDVQRLPDSHRQLLHGCFPGCKRRNTATRVLCAMRVF